LLEVARDQKLLTKRPCFSFLWLSPIFLTLPT
jgi:hypothetical protein